MRALLASAAFSLSTTALAGFSCDGTLLTQANVLSGRYRIALVSSGPYHYVGDLRLDNGRGESYSYTLDCVSAADAGGTWCLEQSEEASKFRVYVDGRVVGGQDVYWADISVEDALGTTALGTISCTYF
jgi:hypothetical protein